MAELTRSQQIVCRLAWHLVNILTRCHQSDAVIWWSAALLRFATTGQRVTASRNENGAVVVEVVDTSDGAALASILASKG